MDIATQQTKSLIGSGIQWLQQRPWFLSILLILIAGAALVDISGVNFRWRKTKTPVPAQRNDEKTEPARPKATIDKIERDTGETRTSALAPNIRNPAWAKDLLIPQPGPRFGRHHKQTTTVIQTTTVAPITKGALHSPGSLIPRTPAPLSRDNAPRYMTQTPGMLSPIPDFSPMTESPYAKLMTQAPENFATLHRMGMLEADGTPTKKLLAHQEMEKKKKVRDEWKGLFGTPTPCENSPKAIKVARKNQLKEEVGWDVDYPDFESDGINSENKG